MELSLARIFESTKDVAFAELQLHWAAMKRLLILIVLFCSTVSAQQRAQLSPAVRAYVSVDAPVIALTHARVIDGTGAAPREDQTLILNNGVITTMGSSASTDVPAGAQTIDLTGKSVIPGLVMVHEHL